MTMRLTIFTFLAAIITVVFAGPISAPVLPSKDTFYEPPTGFESAELGTVLKIRKTPNPLRSIYLEVNVKNSWQLLVRSSSAQGNATAIVTTLVEPYSANSSRLVSYQIAQDSANIDCAASIALQQGANFVENIAAQAEMFLIQAALNENYWVSIPDYEGPQASFAAGRNAGKATLDTIRGVLSSADQFGLSPKAEVVIWGYSGGSIASGWAASLQPWYAPDLTPHLLGVAVGGFASNITTIIQAIDGSLYSGMIAVGIQGVMNEYPELRPKLGEYLPASQIGRFQYTALQCLVPACAFYVYQEVFAGDNRIVPSGESIFQDPVVRSVISNTTLGVLKSDMPQIPVFIYNGEKDHIVPVINAEKMYTYWCENGIKSIELSTSQITRHISEAAFGAPAALAWIGNRFNHLPPVNGCLNTSRITNLLYPGVSSTAVDLITSAVKSVFGFEIGSSLFKREGGLPDLDEVVDGYLESMHKRKNM